MTASLDTLPGDILQHIAFLLATMSATEPPRHLLPLLLANSKIHRTLNVYECPHLYASIFRATFDFDYAVHSQLADSTLAAELHLRHCILWRTRRKDQSSDPTTEELWAALRMVLENAGHNERLLTAADFPTFIMTYVQHRLARAAAASVSSSYDFSATMTTVMWLLCLTLTHQNIVDMPEATRVKLSNALRFPTTTSLRCSTHTSPCETAKPISLAHSANAEHVALLERATPTIILIFALNEVVPITIPTHIPKTRAIALATQRSGPTAEDFRALRESRTPLFAEIRHAQISGTNNSAHSAAYESRIRPLLYSTYVCPSLEGRHVCIPGSLAGLWEGSFMISGEPKPADPSFPPILGDFKCLKPMQCAITEYLCFSPHLPLSSEYPVDQLESAVRSRRFGYDKYCQGSNSAIHAQRDSKEALDIIILGKTLHDHEQAWNGFRFAGRIRSDGLIVMYREPVRPDRSSFAEYICFSTHLYFLQNSRADRGLGTWIFEGHLRYGAAFVGQWRSSISTDTCDLRGIFSLRKTDAAWQE